jgi:putative transposase
VNSERQSLTTEKLKGKIALEMYYWRTLTTEEKRKTLAERRGRKLPWHSPPHLEFEGVVTFIITAACYEHAHIIGTNQQRMAECESKILEICENQKAKIYAWCILPNHYHILVRTNNIKQLRKELGKFHGRISRQWNLEDNETGRKIWFNFFDREMKSARHFWASLNYIHHNPIKHGYTTKWQDWIFSSANTYLDNFGKEKASFIWKEYPILDYGKDWDIY